MDTQALVAQIDEEIARLKQARILLAGADNNPKRGRPAGKSAKKTGKGRQLSPEARARIAAAQKQRWASAKATSKPSS